MDSLYYPSSSRGSVVLPRLEPLQRVIVRAPEDLVVVSGSLIQGIGNPASDYDVFVITSRLPSRADAFPGSSYIEYSTCAPGSALRQPRIVASSDYYGRSGPQIDVRYVLRKALVALERSVNAAWREATRDVSAQVWPLGPDDADLIHKLATGIPLASHSEHHEWASKFPWRRYCYLAYRRKASLYWDFKDIVGAWQVADYERGSELAREFMATQVEAMLHLYGSTNTRRKWLVESLKAEGARCARIGRATRRLFLAGRTTRSKQRSFILACLRVVDAAFAQARGVLSRSPDCVRPAQSLRLLRAEYNGQRHPQAVLEGAFRMNMFRNRPRPCLEFLLKAALRP